MFDFETTMLQSTEYWKNTNRKSYIALYKGMRINTKQVAYLTPGAAKRAISDYLMNVAWSKVYAAYQRDWTATKAAIAAYVKTGFADGSLTVAALEDLPAEPDYDKIEADWDNYIAKQETEAYESTEQELS